MITKEQYDILHGHVDMLDDDPRSVVEALIAEYEAANPPKPEVKCPACGAPMEKAHNDSYFVAPIGKTVG